MAPSVEKASSTFHDGIVCWTVVVVLFSRLWLEPACTKEMLLLFRAQLWVTSCMLNILLLILISTWASMTCVTFCKCTCGYTDFFYFCCCLLNPESWILVWRSGWNWQYVSITSVLVQFKNKNVFIVNKSTWVAVPCDTHETHLTHPKSLELSNNNDALTYAVSCSTSLLRRWTVC